MLRKLTIVAMGTLLACASMLIGVPSAVAASHDGDLRIKGPGGTAYTNGPYVSQVGAEGATLTYTIQVVNTGSTVAQFRIRVTDHTAAPLELYDGTLLVKSLASGPDGYYTKALPPGGNQVLTAKMRIPFHPTNYQYYSTVFLYGTDGVLLDQIYPAAEQAASTGGGSPYSMTARAGSQKPVGNGPDGQLATAGTISSSGTATFTISLRNYGTVGSNIYFRLALSESSAPCFAYAVTVKQGTTNITARVMNGTYNTGVIAPGASRTLKITTKATGPCRYNVWNASSGSSTATIVDYANLVVNQAA